MFLKNENDLSDNGLKRHVSVASNNAVRDRSNRI